MPAWIVPLGLPRWICGFGNWVGGIKKTLYAAEQNRPDVAEKRAHWHEQLAVEPATRLVFVDESGANTKMTRLRGRALGGQRLVARIPHGHYQTSTLIAGMRLNGPCAPWLFEGAMNGEMFLAWVAAGVGAHPAKGGLGDHGQSGHAQNAGESSRPSKQPVPVCLYLPPYSPDFNPIENMWSKIKQILRSQAPAHGERIAPGHQVCLPSHFRRRLPRLSFLTPNTLYDLWKCSSGTRGQRRWGQIQRNTRRRFRFL